MRLASAFSERGTGRGGYWPILRYCSRSITRLLFGLPNTDSYQNGLAGHPTPADWLLRAEDARQLADTMVDAGARHTMLLIAAGYEKMARRAALMQQVDLPTAKGDNC